MLDSEVIRRIWPIWAFNNSLSWLFHKIKRLSLSDIEQQMVYNVKRYGISTCHINDIRPDVNFDELKGYAETVLQKGYTNPRKPFWIDGWPRFSVINEYNPFLRFTLGFLPLANEYLNVYARMNAVRLNLSRLMGTHAPVMSQIWHRDHEDKRIFKVFLYLTDVLDQCAGPFHYVLESQRGGKWNNTFPLNKQKPFSPRIRDEFLEVAIPKKDIKICIGKAGTMIFADTMGLHKGGYCTTDQRIMYMGAFMTDGHFTVGSSRFSVGTYHSFREYEPKIDNITFAERYALGL